MGTFFQGVATCTAWGRPECNRCIPDMEQAFDDLSGFGDHMGFRSTGALTDDTTLAKNLHFQGVQRIALPGSVHLVISSDPEPFGRLSFAALNSRSGDGYRFRSNRLSSEGPDWENSPPPNDRVIASFATENTGHPGGMQSVGNHLFVGEDRPSSGGPKLRVYRLENIQPQVQPVLTRVSSTELSMAKTSFAGATRLTDGRYLIMAGRSDETNINDLRLLFFLSQGVNDVRPDESSAFLWRAQPQHGDNTVPLEVPQGEPFLKVQYSNMDLVSDCAGRQFLLGMGERKTGRHRLHLFRVEDTVSESIDDVKITFIKEKRMFCHTEQKFGCRFSAAAGSYVDPDGKLLIYASEDFEDGPGRSVRMKEFRTKFPVKAGCTEENGWIAYFKEENFEGAQMIVDLQDGTARNYADLDEAYKFDNRTSSIAHCMPPAFSVEHFDGKSFENKLFQVNGTGSLELMPQLGEHHDRITSLRALKVVFVGPDG